MKWTYGTTEVVLSCLGKGLLIRQKRENRMAKKTTKLRPWTEEDVRTLKTLAREKTKTTVIARKLKRSYGATRQKASTLGVSLGWGRKKRRAY